MADKSEPAGNLDVQKSINEAITARTALLTKQTDIMKGQVQLAVELCKALKCEDLDSITTRTQEISTALDGARKEAERLEGSLTNASTAASNGFRDASKETSGLTKNINVATESAKSFGDVAGEAFSKTMAQLDSMIELTSSAGRGIFGIAQSIIAIPLGIFSSLLSMASELANSVDPVRLAMEDVREAFGDLNKGEAAQTLESFDNLQDSSNGLAGSGLALSKVYGYGREGLAAALRDVLATAEAMGPVFGALGDQFTDNAASLMVMQKGLGLTGEEMKAFGSYALMSGQNVNDVLLETANLSLQMGEKFGISSKLIGKDMGYMTANMGKFGSMTKTQMATASVYVRKLGLEIKDIEGTIGVFDDFESAAGAASKLAQAFGMNVDAMQMMNEQDPAKRLDMLRESFAATGKSIENMSRQEKALLAQTAGLDENTVSLALSTENMGMSYEDIQAGAEAAADQQLSQEEIMMQTAENIKQVVEALNNTTGSFLDTFLNGFMKGISQTKEFKAMMQALSQTLVKVFQFGMDVGQIFVDMFPGIKDMMGGVTDFFNPDKIKELLDGFIEPIKTFFSDLSKDPVKATEKFMKTIKEKFLNFFDSKSSEGNKFLDGMKSFGKAIAGILGGLGKMLIEAAADAITGLADYIRNPKGLSDSAEEGIGSIIGPMVDALMSALPALGSALLDLIGAVLTEYGPQIALLVSGLMAANLAAGLMGSVVEMGKSAVADAAKEKLKSFLTSFSAPQVPDAGGDGGAGAVDMLGGVVEAFNKIDVKQVLKAVGVAAVMAVFAAGSLVLFALAVKKAASILEQTKMEDIEKVFLAAGIGVMATIGLALTASLLMADGGMTLLIGGLGMIAAAIFLTLGLPRFAEGVRDAAAILQDTPFESVLKTFASVGLAIIALAALAVVAAGVGALLVTAGPLVVLGLVAGALMLYDGVMLFGIALAEIVNNFPDVPLGKVTKIMLLTVGAILGAAAIAAVGAVAAAAAPLLLLAGIGVLALSEFLIETMKSLGGAIEIIAGIPMANPEEMADRMSVVASLVNSLTAFAGLAVDAAQMGVISKLLGGGGIEETIASLNSFMQAAVGSIIALVVVLAAIASEWDEAMLKKVEAVANLMGAIGTLAGALTAPMEAFASIEGEIFGESATQKMDKVMTGIGTVMDKITEKLPKIVEGVARIDLKDLTPEKADTLSKVMTGISDITKAMNENAELMQKEGFDATKIASNFSSALSNVDFAMRNLDFYMPEFAKYAESLAKYKELDLSGTVTAIIEDIKATNDALAELGTVDISATVGKVGAALGLKDEILKVESKPIQMNVSINLTMRADDIAKEIMDVTAKIAKDSDKASEGMKELFPGLAT